MNMTALETIDLIVRIGMVIFLTTALPCAIWGIYKDITS